VKRSRLIFFCAVITLLGLSPFAAGNGATSRSLTLSVYQDGYVHVSQTLAVSSKATSIQVPLLSGEVSDLVATDQNGSPLSYGFPQGGSNVTIYTLGAGSVRLTYDTSSLTFKNGTVWTLKFVSLYNSTVLLPPLSSLGSVSGVPYSINENGSSPELALSPGEWTISYGVAFVGTSSTSTGTTGGPGSPGPGQLPIEAGALAAVAAVAVVLLFLWWKRRPVATKGELRPDDVQVLNFIKEKGGKVLEPEIRTRFALPKTSAWRQIKRLERMGYVRVTKIGSQNQIELKERKSEP
jgi:uncharacterized membrane protein